MVIKNLTSGVQKIKVEDIFDGKVYEVYVQSHGVATFDEAILPDKDKLIGIIEILGGSMETEVDPALVQEDPSEESEITMETESEEEITPTEETTPEVDPAPEVIESQFVCDICGAEFASARGLTSHRNRSHSHES